LLLQAQDEESEDALLDEDSASTKRVRGL
jgi:hypothetical protein